MDVPYAQMCVCTCLEMRRDFPLDDHLLIERDDILVPRVRLRETEGEIVGFAPGVHQETHGQRFRKERGQSTRADHQIVVQEAVVGREQCHLLLAGAHHRRVTVADCKSINFNH